MHREEYGPGESPLAAIQRLAAHGASGELIAASDAIEVHVYFLDGRLAWATSSTARRAFVEHLVEHHGVAADAIRDVIEECQRSRRRLGETLVEWGLATTAQVRDALGAQIAGALATIASHPTAQTIFLPRRMTYSHELTFELAELVPSRAPSDLDELAARLVATVLDSIPAAQWIAVVAGNETVARAARSQARTNDFVSARRALDDAELDAVIARGHEGAIFGQRLPGRGATLWCGAGPDAKIGVAAAILATAASAATAPVFAVPSGSWHERPGVGASVLAGAMRTTDDLIAAFVIDRDGGASGAWRGDGALDQHAAVARALVPLVRGGLSLRGQRGALAYHGAMPASLRTSLWLVMPGWVSQGLGWALLQAVTRQVADAVGADA